MQASENIYDKGIKAMAAAELLGNTPAELYSEVINTIPAELYAEEILTPTRRRVKQMQLYNGGVGDGDGGDGNSQGVQIIDGQVYYNGADTGISESDWNTLFSSNQTEDKLTYEEFVAQQKAQAEEDRKKALKEAEAYLERAEADANTSYLQNKSTYGTNAETLARMGLTGSGYSDYLNAQAYSKLRDDMQQAKSNYLDMKDNAETTYQDNLSAWDEKLATKLLTDQTYSDNAYNEVLSAVQNTYKYDQYTENGIRALGELYKWDEDKINGLIDTWKATAGVKDEATTSFYDDALKLAQNGFKGTDAEGYTRDQVYEMLLQARTDGDVTNEEVTSIMEAYDVWDLYNRGEIDVDTYYDYLSGDDVAKQNAKTKITEAQNKTNTEGVKEKADESLKNKGIESTGDIVSIYSKNFDVSQFGNFGNSGGKQEKYINAVINMAKNNQLAVGDIVSMNYGARALNNAEKGNWKLEHNYGMYVYAGNGQFSKLSDAEAAKVDSNDIKLPEGYHIGWFGTIRDD